MNDHSKIVSSIKNPLSIIAIFVFLIEGLATLAMMNNALTEAQRYWFVVFCTVFPLIVFLAFFLLAWFRPVNFYGPQDYSDEQVFLKLMRASKIEDEIDGVINTQKDNSSGLSSRMEVAARVMNAEQRAFEELQKEFKSPMLYQIRSSDGAYLFDGVIQKGPRMIYVEVKYISGVFLSPVALGQIHRFAEITAGSEKLLAIVSPTVLSDTAKDKIKSRIESIDNGILLRFYSL